MGSFLDEWIIPHSVGVSSLLVCRFGRSGSSEFVDGGAVSLTGFEDEGRLAVEADVKKLFKFF